MSSFDLTAAIEAARDNLAQRDGNARLHRECGKACMHYYNAESAVHVAAPLIESATRDQVAQEIATVAAAVRAGSAFGGIDAAYATGLDRAARIARGGSR